MNEGTRRFEARMKAYGFRQVPASTVYAIFDEVVQLNQFSKLKNGLLARQVNNDIVHLVQLAARKGAAYGFTWGLSLSYVPHDWDPKCKFHRTLKAARFDLFEDPGEFLIADRHSSEAFDYIANILHGEVCFRSDLEIAWRKLQQYVEQWMASATTVADVASKALEQVNREWRTFRHHPDPRFVYAFTLARLQRLSEAARELDSLITLDRERYGPLALRECMEKVATQPLSTG